MTTLAGVGVLTHQVNPSPADVAALAATAEAHGAGWIGFPDAFWWRDVWVLLAAAAAATTHLAIGPTMTNPYMRHPFQTLAALATLQDAAGPRLFLGIAAGGSEVEAAAHVSRRDAPARVAELAGLARAVGAGAPLDEASGRRLEVPLAPCPIVIAARGDRMLEAAGAHGDLALLQTVPASDLARSTARVLAAARAAGRPGRLGWAPLVDVADPRGQHRTIAVYAALNSTAATRSAWGLEPDAVHAIRAELVRGGTPSAAGLVPRAALDDLVLASSDPGDVAARAHEVGATDIVVHCYDVTSLPELLEWGKAVAARLAGS